MKTRRLLLAFAACVFASSGAVVLHAAQNVSPAVTAAVNDPARPQADKDRDGMRRPAAMLAASGIKARRQGDRARARRRLHDAPAQQARRPDGKGLRGEPADLQREDEERPAPDHGQSDLQQCGRHRDALLRAEGPRARRCRLDVGELPRLQEHGAVPHRHERDEPRGLAALKPGGRYIVTDFTTQPGQGLHRRRCCIGSIPRSSAWKCSQQGSCSSARAMRSRILRIPRRRDRTRTRIRSISSSANRADATRVTRPTENRRGGANTATPGRSLRPAARGSAAP